MWNRSSVMAAPGAPGAAEVCALRFPRERLAFGLPLLAQKINPWKTKDRETENYQSSTWKPYSRECNEEGVVKGYVSTGRTFTTVTLRTLYRDGNKV